MAEKETQSATDKEKLSAEEEQRRTDELIQKMLQEDQANAAQFEEGEYDEEDLPDENGQIEVIRRMTHQEVADEGERQLELLEQLKRQKAALESSPSPQSTPEKSQGPPEGRLQPFSASPSEQLPVAPKEEKKQSFMAKLFGNNKPKPAAAKPEEQKQQQQQQSAQPQTQFDQQMAAAIAASLTSDTNPEPSSNQVSEAASQAETEELLLMIAQKESAMMEKERQQKERALATAEARKPKFYDDIVFDSNAIKEIHPRLHEVNVHHLNDLGVLDYSSVQIDGELFMRLPSADADSYPSGEEESSGQMKNTGQSKPSTMKQWVDKADKFFTNLAI